MINDLNKITDDMCNRIDLINQCMININKINRRDKMINEEKEGFLVLTRHKKEGITMELPNGENISIIILDIGNKQTRLGIKASKDITIHRDEIWERIKNKQSEDK